MGRTDVGGDANDGGSFGINWCVLRSKHRLGVPRMGLLAGFGQTAADAYCQGHQSKRPRPGESLAVDANPLARGQVIGRPPSEQ